MYVLYRKTDQVKEIPVTQARAVLAELVNEVAYGRERITFTRHGKPYAAVVPLKDLENSRGASRASSNLLALRGTGQGLWGANAGQTIAKLRGEWGDD